jgi:hypothetical protein
VNVIDPAFRDPLLSCSGQAASLTIMRNSELRDIFPSAFLAASHDNAQYFGNREDAWSVVFTRVEGKFRVTVGHMLELLRVTEKIAAFRVITRIPCPQRFPIKHAEPSVGYGYIETEDVEVQVRCMGDILTKIWIIRLHPLATRKRQTLRQD